MVAKRKSIASSAAGTPASRQGSAKRQKVEDISTPSRQKDALTLDQKSKLMQWLEKKATSGQGVCFPISLLPVKGGTSKSRGGKAKKASASTEQLTIDGHEYGTVAYTIGNRSQWSLLTKYRKCTVGTDPDEQETLGAGQCIIVRGDDPPDATGAEKFDPALCWKAQLHEVRAVSQNHVFLRVTWLYRPSKDLPDGVRSYHARNELVPSTEMTIIDAQSVYGSINIKYWDEYKDDEVPPGDGYFWRQSYDNATGTLSSCRMICKCAQPQNPDHPIVQCNHCQEWMHAECLEEDAISRVQGHPKLGEMQANGGAEPSTDDDTAETKKETSLNSDDIKVATISSSPITAELRFEGVKDRQGKPLITLVDRRPGEVKKEEEQEVSCLFCDKVID